MDWHEDDAGGGGFARFKGTLSTEAPSKKGIVRSGFCLFRSKDPGVRRRGRGRRRRTAFVRARGRRASFVRSFSPL